MKLTFLFDLNIPQSNLHFRNGVSLQQELVLGVRSTCKTLFAYSPQESGLHTMESRPLPSISSANKGPFRCSPPRANKTLHTLVALVGGIFDMGLIGRLTNSLR